MFQDFQTTPHHHPRSRDLQTKRIENKYVGGHDMLSFIVCVQNTEMEKPKGTQKHPRWYNNKLLNQMNTNNALRRVWIGYTHFYHTSTRFCMLAWTEYTIYIEREGERIQVAQYVCALSIKRPRNELVFETGLYAMLSGPRLNGWMTIVSRRRIYCSPLSE